MTFTLGTDTSHWSGNIDFAKMYNAGARFWITKATDANKSTGLLFEDTRFNTYMTDASKTPLLKGCYHWLQASVDPIKAADFYLERYKRYPMDFPPILDFEETSVRDTGGFSDYAWRAQEWVKRCQDVAGRKPIIYTAKWYTSYFTDKMIGWMGDYPLWVASYPFVFTSLSKPLMPSQWANWTMWQYTDKGKGDLYGTQSKSVDLNYYQGSMGDLLTFLGVSETPPEPLTLEQRVERIEKHLGIS